MMLKKDVYHAKTTNIEDELSDATNLPKNIIFNTKINVKNEILSINNLPTTAALNKFD